LRLTWEKPKKVNHPENKNGNKNNNKNGNKKKKIIGIP
jgi:hypothetical protein